MSSVLVEQAGNYHIGLLICPECGQEVPGAIGENGDTPLLHILGGGKECPGSGTVYSAEKQEEPEAELVAA